ncbi:anti-sigma factor family protein [Neorhodopirellula lusitana]|uniref:anti-sigma factor family protein n=1 Tax=Neorhodopirellula lusitana TaxID=445327 RepID=UPI00384CEEC9
MVRQDFEAHSDWEECTPGTIGDLHDRLNADRRRKSVVRMGTPIAVIALLGMGVWNYGGSANPSTHPKKVREFGFGGVTCSEVQASMQHFAIGQLTPNQQQAFTLHLQQCPVCREKMEAMKKAEMPMVDKNLIGNSPNGFQTHRTLLASNID